MDIQFPPIAADEGFALSMHTLRKRGDKNPDLRDDELHATVRRALAPLRQAIRRGDRVGITAGSRGIANIAQILRACGDEVRSCGGSPVILVAMGSHGGASAAGQRAVLSHYGVTEEALGMPLLAEMEVTQIGQHGDAPIFFSTAALTCDRILVVNRIREHSDFSGPIQSGLAKSLTIGLGKDLGAQTIHARGVPGLKEYMPPMAQEIVRRTGKIAGGLGILENARDETTDVCWVDADGIGGRAEAALLARAKRLLPIVPFREVDVLIVDEMGKDKSGVGMDPNVIGRRYSLGEAELPRPLVRAIVILNLTEFSNGNAFGVGLADFTTERLLSKIDFRATYLNGMIAGTSGLRRLGLPIVLPNDRAAIATALKMVGVADPAKRRVVRIRNTHDLMTVQVSTPLVGEVVETDYDVVGDPAPLAWDRDGFLRPLGAPAV